MGNEKQDVMIRLHDIGKVYRLGEIGNGTLQQDLQSWWAKVRGREDPNSKIGQVNRIDGTRFLALQHVDLEIRKGERIGIIGGNGAGKSTLLKIICRITAPSSGSMALYGKVTSMLEVGTGFHPEMTGRENVYLNGALLGMSRKQIDEKMEEIIEFSEVREFIDTPVKRYSSGMYVKLAFSVAAHLESDIVIMDEVLAVGDIAFQNKCIEKMLASSRQEDRTILYVSHNMQTIRKLCDRCIVLHEGKLVYDGDVEEAIRYYAEYLMQQTVDETELALRPRRDRNITGKCRIAAVSTQEETIYPDAPLHFDVDVLSDEELAHAVLRMMVCDESGKIVGMTYSDETRLEKGENSLSFVFPTSPLAAGVYFCDLVICEYQDNRQIRHDFLSKVLTFTVIENQKYFGQNWTSRAWGSVRLNHMTVERRRQNER